MKATMKRALAAAAVMAAMGWAASAQAVQGFYIGSGFGLASPNASGDLLDQVDPKPALAWEYVNFGYNFNDVWGLSVQWGEALGDAGFDPDLAWQQDYFTVCARYTFDRGGAFTPYVELGGGAYLYTLSHPEYDITSDVNPGLRAAIGANFYLGSLYIAPELSYHYVNYTGTADVHDVIYGSYDADFHERGDMLLFLLKTGLHFGG